MRARLAVLLLLAACDMSRPAKPQLDGGVQCDLAVGTGSIAIDVTCRNSRCGAIAVQEACSLQVRLGDCEEPASFDLRVAEDGAVLGGTSELFGTCQPLEPRPDGLFSLACERGTSTCRADIYAAGQTIDAELTTLRLVDGLYQMPASSNSQAIDRDDAFEGYLAGAALIGDQLAISTFRGEYSGLECARDPSELVFIDRATATVVHTATTPSCLTHLARDPSREELIGLFGGQAPQLGRFDRQGKLLASRALELPPETPELITIGLHLLDRRAYVVISSDDEPWYTFLIRADLDTLETIGASERMEAFTRTSRLYGERMIVGDVARAKVQSFDLEGRILPFIPVLDDTFVSDDVGFLAIHPDTENLMVATTGRRSAVWRLLPTATPAIIGRSQFYEAEAVPWAMSVWPPDRAVMAVGLTEQTEPYRAVLSLYEVAETRFRAGTLVLGRGLVSKLFTDPEDRVWAMLPWSGELVRITPR